MIEASSITRIGLYAAHVQPTLDDEGYLRKQVFDVVAFLKDHRAGKCDDWGNFEPLDVDFCGSERNEDIVQECIENGWLVADSTNTEAA